MPPSSIVTFSFKIFLSLLFLHQISSINLSNNLPNAEVVHLQKLSRTSIKNASLKGSYIQDKVSQWLMENKEDEFVQQRLFDCSKNYEDAVEKLEDSIVAIDNKCYEDAKKWTETALNVVETCVEECSHDSPLVEMSIGFTYLCSDALAIVSTLAHTNL